MAKNGKEYPWTFFSDNIVLGEFGADSGGGYKVGENLQPETPPNLECIVYTLA
jgi:hypothetical protein